MYFGMELIMFFVVFSFALPTLPSKVLLQIIQLLLLLQAFAKLNLEQEETYEIPNEE